MNKNIILLLTITCFNQLNGAEGGAAGYRPSPFNPNHMFYRLHPDHQKQITHIIINRNPQGPILYLTRLPAEILTLEIADRLERIRNNRPGETLEEKDLETLRFFQRKYNINLIR